MPAERGFVFPLPAPCYLLFEEFIFSSSCFFQWRARSRFFSSSSSESFRPWSADQNLRGGETRQRTQTELKREAIFALFSSPRSAPSRRGVIESAIQCPLYLKLKIIFIVFPSHRVSLLTPNQVIQVGACLPVLAILSYPPCPAHCYTRLSASDLRSLCDFFRHFFGPEFVEIRHSTFFTIICTT